MTHKPPKDFTREEILAEADACIHAASAVAVNAFNSIRLSVEKGEFSMFDALQLFSKNGWILTAAERDILKAAEFVYRQNQKAA